MLQIIYKLSNKINDFFSINNNSNKLFMSYLSVSFFILLWILTISSIFLTIPTAIQVISKIICLLILSIFILKLLNNIDKNS